jgi:hypothetical protein
MDFGFPLYFNHVPKCAGTSLNEVLSRGLHREAIGLEPFLSAVEFYTLRSDAFDRLVLVGSHVPHWVARRRLRDWTRVTALRDPWSRFQALCRHLLRIASSEPQALSPPQVEFLRILREARYVDALWQARVWYPANASMTSYFLAEPLEAAGDLPAKAAEEAAREMSGYNLVLLAQHLRDDALLLDFVLNGQRFGVSTPLNTSRHYDDVSTGPFPEEFASLFEQLYPYERDIYAAGCELYPRSRAWLQSEFDSGHRGPVRSRRATPPLYRLDWDSPARCGGFSDRLFAASLGFERRVARRVEGGSAVLEIDLPPAPHGRLEAVFWLTPIESRFGLRFSFDGAPLTFFDERREVGCPADPNQMWSWAEIPAPVSAGAHLLEIDRSGVASLGELWVLDLVVRDR